MRVSVSTMDKAEMALEIAIQIAEKRAELKLLEQKFRAFVDGGLRLAPRVEADGDRPQGKLGRVLGVLEANPGRVLTPFEVTSQLGGDLDRKYVQVLMASLVELGHIEKLPMGRGQYRLKTAAAATA